MLAGKQFIKIKFTPEEKLNLVLKFRELNISLSQFCRIYGVERTAMLRWSIKYDNEGPEGLKTIKKNTKYSSYTLIHSVQDYLSGKFSMLQIVKKYNYKRIYRLMKEELKISSVIRRKKKKYIKSSVEYKAEKYYLKRYETLKDLEEAIEEYIKFYNEERLQKNLGNRSPLEYRKYQEKNIDN